MLACDQQRSNEQGGPVPPQAPLKPATGCTVHLSLPMAAQY